MAQVIEILTRARQGLAYFTKPLRFLASTGHQWPCYWPNQTKITRSLHAKGKKYISTWTTMDHLLPVQGMALLLSATFGFAFLNCFLMITRGPHGMFSWCMLIRSAERFTCEWKCLLLFSNYHFQQMVRYTVIACVQRTDDLLLWNNVFILKIFEPVVLSCT